MAQKGCSKEKGKATAGAKMPTSVINSRLLLDRDRRKGFISHLIRGLIRIYNVRGVKDDRAWDLLRDVIDFSSSHESPLFTIPATVATPLEQEFSFSGVVSNLPLISRANV